MYNVTIIEFSFLDIKKVLVSVIKTLISNGNRTECSPSRSVIVQVITKSDDRANLCITRQNFREKNGIAKL